jgi:hypothetical protein
MTPTPEQAREAIERVEQTLLCEPAFSYDTAIVQVYSGTLRTLLSLAKEGEKMREALGPFAALAKRRDIPPHTHFEVINRGARYGRLNGDDFIRALAAFPQGPGAGERSE